MTVLAIFSTAVAAFLAGFLLGTHPVHRERPAKHSLPVFGEEANRLKQEYSNFLSYDGTEQSQK